METVKKHKNTKWYILVFVVVNLITVMVLIYYENRYVEQSLKKHAKQYEQEVGLVMENYTHSFELFSHMLSREIENHPSPDDIWTYLKSIDKTMLAIEGDTFDGLYMYYQGRYLYSWDTPYSQYESTGYVATERPWYKDAAAGKGKVVFTPPYMSYANHYILSTISQLQPDGETVFAYDIKMGDIQNLVKTLKNYKQEQIMVFDTKGTIIGSNNENYLGGNLRNSLQETKQARADAQKALQDAKGISGTEKQKLKEQVDSADAFYQFQKKFDVDFRHLARNEQKPYLFHLKDGYFYGYLAGEGDYQFLIMIPFTSMLMDSIQVWLVPLLLVELLLIYFLGRVTKELKNRELKATYIELGQTQKRLELALSVAQKAAAIDELTGMMNLKSFRSAVNEEIASMEGNERGIFIMLDGDHFKRVNDEYGHLIGDEVIKLAAQMIVGRIRTVDLASRLHGDEFAIFVSNTDDYEVAKSIMQDINATMAKEAEKRKMPKITLSSGAVVVKPHDSYIDLAKRADDALYEAKKTHDGGFYGDSSDSSVK